ncbi:hypothetical protein B0A52_02592 [Exophiala mesophila]|uniref:DJ-1/PfpI domain-containing protein n=1 Tax=Exophiala mesophila TaxID=212818 RepID=A0A438ND23_EXOME|nr:hypothetical protein B0A52_02592 [Exophiala mesophila]
MSQPQPLIFAFSLDHPSAHTIFQAVHGRLMDKIAEKSDLKHVKSSPEALNLIEGDAKPKAIFVADAGITVRENHIIADRVISYARNGGTVVLGGLFSSMIGPIDLQKFFSRWNLPWKSGTYLRTTVALNHTAEGVPKSGLPSSYSQKAVFLAGVDSSAAWYLPTESSVVESLVFASEPITRTSETPIAFTKVGNGWLGFVGDVNGEEGTDAVVLGMLGLF